MLSVVPENFTFLKFLQFLNSIAVCFDLKRLFRTARSISQLSLASSRKRCRNAHTRNQLSFPKDKQIRVVLWVLILSSRSVLVLLYISFSYKKKHR